MLVLVGMFGSGELGKKKIPWCDKQPEKFVSCRFEPMCYMGGCTLGLYYLVKPEDGEECYFTVDVPYNSGDSNLGVPKGCIDGWAPM